ncbi:Phospholipid-transporting ATPase ABCA3 [Halotydeus destructor]|nr:Phospholipid-transporting ATPase ABCA3 [Halotydeus destructor]
MLWWQQAKALLWKCYIVRKRHPFTLAFELLLPLVLSLLVTHSFYNTLPDVPAGSASPLGPDKPSYSPATIYKDPVYTFPDNLRRDLEGFTRIWYAPQNKFTDQLIEQVVQIAIDQSPDLARLITVVPFADEASMLKSYYNVSRSGYDIKALIAFHDTNGVVDVKPVTKLSYTLHPRQYFTPSVSTLFPYKTYGPRYSSSSNYYASTSRFVIFQALINEAFIKLKAQSIGVSNNVTSWNAWKFPYPKYFNPTQDTSFFKLFPPLIIFGFIVTFPIIVKRIAEEKVNKSREMFRIMGMSDSVYWSTTFVSFFLIYIFQAIILTYVFTHKWKGIMSMLNGADMSVVFAIFLLYGAGFLTFGMFLAIPFTKPVLAVVFAVIIATITYTVPASLLDPILNASVDPVATNLARYLCCLLPNFSFTTAISLMSRRAMFSESASWSTLFDSNSSFCIGTMSLGHVMVMMVLQILLYTSLIWYLDKVWPWQDGVPKPWYFPFQVQYWKSVLCFKEETSDVKAGNLDHGPNSRYFERQLSRATNVISIRKLRKRFGNKMAVDGVDMDVKQGEITCLLGHNGAGKTTTMSMITGLFPATEGTIIVNGYDVASQTSKARESISLCPQHNVLYDELNVLEHLKLYAAIKGLPWSECGPSAIKQANVTQLGECLTKLPSQLSGGMKRKLCLGIALVGDTQLVILDEPTSGLDPEARRMIWDVLREVRRERTILLTTHYMEEADALADSIAIMTAGKVSCHGTPMYLKKLFSTGYMLRVAKGVGYDGQAVEELVKQYFPRGGMRSEIDTEVIFALESQNGQTDSSKLPDFFRRLEQLKPKLGVASFGLSLTTLEDVFLKVGEMESSNEETQSTDSTSILRDHDDVNYQTHTSQETLNLDPNDARPERVEGHALMYQRFKGLFLKRVHFGKRYWPMLTMQMAIPAIVFGLAMFLSNYLMSESSGPAQLEVTAIKRLYGDTNGFVEAKNLTHFESVGEEQGIKFDHIEPNVNVSTYLLDVADKVGLNDYIRKNLFGATLDQEGDNETYNLWYQFEAYHTLPAAVNMLYESRLNQLTGENNHIDVTSVPLQYQSSGDFEMRAPPELIATMLAILVGLSVPFLTASYVLFPIHERASQSKLLQLMTGLPVWLFWLASLLFDLISHMIASLFILTVVALVDNHSTFTTWLRNNLFPDFTTDAQRSGRHSHSLLLLVLGQEASLRLRFARDNLHRNGNHIQRNGASSSTPQER